MNVASRIYIARSVSMLGPSFAIGTQSAVVNARTIVRMWIATVFPSGLVIVFDDDLLEKWSLLSIGLLITTVALFV